MTERGALLIAGVGHLALLAALSLSLSHRLPPQPQDDFTPIEYVEIGPSPSVTEQAKPSMEAAPQDEGTPPPTDADLPQPEPPPEPLEVKDVATPDAIAEQPKPKAEPKPKVAPKAAPKAAPRAPSKKPEKEAFDAGALANLIDKSLPKSSVRPKDTSAFAKSIERAIPKGARISPVQVATLEQAIRSQIAPCWNPPIGGADVANMTAVLRIRLTRAGAVVGTPEFVSQTGATAGNQAYARAFVESARRAVLRCTPLDLPADLYRYWQEFELNFDPRLMT